MVERQVLAAELEREQGTLVVQLPAAERRLLERAPRLQPGGLQIDVADTGSGIPPQDRETVFAPFHRLDPARTDGGSGLGLAIARAIVEAHGGRIWVADADADAGTRIRIVLRALPADLPALA